MSITLDVARHCLWHFGDFNLGQDGGHFVNRLFQLASAADEENLAKLRDAWPQHMQAFEAVKTKPWGLDWLRGIVKDYLDGEANALDLFAVAAER